MPISNKTLALCIIVLTCHLGCLIVRTFIIHCPGMMGMEARAVCNQLATDINGSDLQYKLSSLSYPRSVLLLHIPTTLSNMKVLLVIYFKAKHNHELWPSSDRCVVPHHCLWLPSSSLLKRETKSGSPQARIQLLVRGRGRGDRRLQLGRGCRRGGQLCRTEHCRQDWDRPGHCQASGTGAPGKM